MTLGGRVLFKTAASSSLHISGVTRSATSAAMSTSSLTKVSSSAVLRCDPLSCGRHTGYPLTKFSIRPFNDYDLTDNAHEARIRRRFNRRLSSLRIFVEHAFGRLKGRFPVLRCFPGRNVDEMYKTVEALMIIHNILERFHDDPNDIEGFNDEEDDDVDDIRGEAEPQLDVDSEMSEDDLYAAGVARRKWLVDLMRHELDY